MRPHNFFSPRRISGFFPFIFSLLTSVIRSETKNLFSITSSVRNFILIACFSRSMNQMEVWKWGWCYLSKSVDFVVFFVYIFFPKFIFIVLWCSSPILRSWSKWEVGRHIFKKRRLLRFCLWLLETSQTSDRSQNKSNGGCLRGMLYTIVHFFTNKRCALSLYISAWAISALLVQTTMGNAKAFVERDE